MKEDKSKTRDWGPKQEGQREGYYGTDSEGKPIGLIMTPERSKNIWKWKNEQKQFQSKQIKDILEAAVDIAAFASGVGAAGLGSVKETQAIVGDQSLDVLQAADHTSRFKEGSFLDKSTKFMKSSLPDLRDVKDRYNINPALAETIKNTQGDVRKLKEMGLSREHYDKLLEYGYID